MKAKLHNSINWDAYFPIINKAVLVFMFAGTVMAVSGVDLFQMGSKLFSSSNAISAESQGELVVSSDLTGGTSKPKSGLAAWKNTIAAAGVMFGLVVLALYILTIGGRDAERMKEQKASRKKDNTPLDKEGAAPTVESTECNLATYKLFYATETTNKPAE